MALFPLQPNIEKATVLHGVPLLISNCNDGPHSQHIHSLSKVSIGSQSSVPSQTAPMLNTKRLIEMAKKWHRAAALGRRRISSERRDDCPDSGACHTFVADKGYFIVYSLEGKRFMVPLSYLNNNIFKELFRMSEDEFGLSGDGPITLPCDAVLMEYIMFLLRGRASENIERALLTSIFTLHCSASTLHVVGHSQQLVVCS